MELNNLVSYNPNLLKSILLLVLAVSGNFVGNTLGCKTQYHMTNNMYVKHILIIFITFFTLNYTTSENEDPSKQIVRAFLIWTCYLLFTKQNITFTGLSASFLVLTYMFDTFYSYYEKLSKEGDLKYKEKANKFNNLKEYSFKAGLLTVLVGFSMYFMEKYDEYGDSFDILTFILGKTTCKSLS